MFFVAHSDECVLVLANAVTNVFGFLWLVVSDKCQSALSNVVTNVFAFLWLALTNVNVLSQMQ